MKRIAIATLALLIAGALAVPAQAQTSRGTNFGAIYLSAAPNEHVDYAQELALATPFDFYLVAEIDYADIGAAQQNDTNGLKAWEASFDVPAEITIIDETLAGPGPINIASGPQNYIIGTGGNLRLNTLPGPLVSLQALVLQELTETVVLRPGPSTPSSALNDDAPAWTEFNVVPEDQCEANNNPTPCLREFTDIGNLRVSTGVDTDEGSWGSMKAQFGSD